MALTPVLGHGGASSVLDLALSSSYLGSGNEIVVTRASRFDLWCDDAAIAITVSYTHLTLPTNREV